MDSCKQISRKTAKETGAPQEDSNITRWPNLANNDVPGNGRFPKKKPEDVNGKQNKFERGKNRIKYRALGNVKRFEVVEAKLFIGLNSVGDAAL